MFGFLAGVARGYGWLNEKYAHTYTKTKIKAYIPFLSQLPALQSALINLYESAYVKEKATDMSYLQALDAVRGNPITSALMHARAVTQIVQMPEIRAAMRQLARHGRRFQFFELYTSTVPKALAGPSPYTNADFDAAPFVDALTLRPPVDILDQLHEVAVRRRMDVDEQIAITAGASATAVPTSASQLQATAAHHALVYTLQHDRRVLRAEHLFASIAQQAGRLIHDASALLAAVYGKGGGNSGDDMPSYVAGDDELWSCLPAGVYARLVMATIAPIARAEQRLRDGRAAASAKRTEFLKSGEFEQFRDSVESQHNAYLHYRAASMAFQEAQSAGLSEEEASENQNTSEEYNKARDEFTEKRNARLAKLDDLRKSTSFKAMLAAQDAVLKQFQAAMSESARLHVDAFLDAWRAAARKTIRLATPSALTVDTTDLLRQSAQAANRLSALGVRDAFVIALSASPILQTELIDKVHIAPIVNQDANNPSAIEARASKFLDQLEDRALPPNADGRPRSMAAMWAARRVGSSDLAKVARMESTSDDGEFVRDLTNRMAGLVVDEEAPNDRCYFYCPTGNVLDALPGTVPFDSVAETTRVVRLVHLRNAIGYLLASAACPPSNESRPNVVVESVESGGGDHLGRHPLVLTFTHIANQTTVQYFRSQYTAMTTTVASATDATDAADAAPQSLLEAARALATKPLADRMKRLRLAAIVTNEINFNADRLKHAVSLAMARRADNGRVIVHLAGRDFQSLCSDVFAVAVAMALIATEFENDQTFSNAVYIQYPEYPDSNSNPRIAVDEHMKQIAQNLNGALGKGCRIARVGEVILSHVLEL